jgi:hypothetical protein
LAFACTYLAATADLRLGRGHRVESIEFIGSAPLDLGCLRARGFKRVATVPRMSTAAELGIECGHGAPVFTSRNFARAQRQPYRAERRSGSFLCAEHYALIERSYEHREMNGYLAATAVAWPAALQLADVSRIEAFRDDRLVGFVALHRAFEGIGLALFMAHDPSPGVADFLYANLVSNCRELSLRSVNVDSSPSTGHLRFKQKWRGQVTVPPCYVARWSRGAMTRRTYASWGARLLRRSNA